MTPINPINSAARETIAAGFIELALDEFAMIGIAGFFEGRKTIRGRRRLFLAKRRQVLDADPVILVHDHHALDGVPQTRAHCPGHEYRCIASIALGSKRFSFFP